MVDGSLLKSNVKIRCEARPVNLSLSSASEETVPDEGCSAAEGPPTAAAPSVGTQAPGRGSGTGSHPPTVGPACSHGAQPAAVADGDD